MGDIEKGARKKNRASGELALANLMILLACSDPSIAAPAVDAYRKLVTWLPQREK
jgi:hypothetical protein